jgi:hypothetical protein
LNTVAGTCSNVIACPNATGAVINNICVNCTAIPHNNGPDVGNTACACIVPYQWSWNATDNTGSCVCSLPSQITILSSPGCFDCATVVYGPGTVSANACNCDANFLWDAISLTCYCPVTWTLNVGAGTCTCNTTTSAVINGICVDCTKIWSNAGPNGNNTACTCLTPDTWVWDSTYNVGFCYCNSTY